MGTRSMIGVGTISNFEGRYCHWDGYPTGVGKALWDNWHATFDGDLQQLADFVLKTEYGWSALASKDFSKQPRWLEYGEYEQYPDTPQWYDTRPGEDRGDKWTITHADNLAASWMEWAYLINLEDNCIEVYRITTTRLKRKGEMHYNVQPDFAALESE